MGSVNFLTRMGFIAVLAGIAPVGFAQAEPAHGIAMYGEPALPPDFVSLPYANPDAPKGGRIVWGDPTGFDSLHSFAQKGRPPWPLRFLGYDSLMGRSRDEPFALYGLLAESIEVGPAREWVEFSLREEARFSDGSPVTVEDVIWSYETLGRDGHGRYAGFAAATESITQTGPRSLRITFNTDNPELALVAGLRPILKKADWEGKDFTQSTLDYVPIGAGPYVVGDFESGRFISMVRNPDYWGKDLPLRRGTHNLDEVRIEYYGDSTVIFEAFKAGALTLYREANAEAWATQYDFPAATRGDVVQSEIGNRRPSGMVGYVMNTRREKFADWRVREALLQAFNFEYINDSVTGGRQTRITSYFSNSELGMRPGPATGRVLTYLQKYADDLPPGAIEGYEMPVSDGTERNRKNLRRATKLLQEAGWQVQDGVLVDQDGAPFTIEILLRKSSVQNRKIMDVYAQTLKRLGIRAEINPIDDAQFVLRSDAQDFDMTYFERALSLSPGNEQALYWGSERADNEGSRNWMGVKSPAVDGLINDMLGASSQEDFVAATRALDRVLTAGRYVIPLYQSQISRMAHSKNLHYPTHTPAYGDWGTSFMPEVWWYEEKQ